VVFALFVVSKSGGLIYNREFHAGMSKLTSNDYLMLAGSFHGYKFPSSIHIYSYNTNLLRMHAITAQLSPVPPVRQPPPSTTTPNLQTFPVHASGIEVLESSHFRIQCFQTQTGVKFLLFTEPQQPSVDTMMKKIYELYADYVMKNPFYTVEMPIRCEKFDRGLDGFVKVRG
jgi:hypothetical protein